VSSCNCCSTSGMVSMALPVTPCRVLQQRVLAALLLRLLCQLNCGAVMVP
jgi:hypothetical protein